MAVSWKHLKEMAHRFHNQPDVEIGLLIGLNIPSAIQIHLRQRKLALDSRENVRVDTHWSCVSRQQRRHCMNARESSEPLQCPNKQQYQRGTSSSAKDDSLKSPLQPDTISKI